MFGQSQHQPVNASEQGPTSRSLLQRVTAMSCRRAWLVVGAWIAIAIVLNVSVPQLEQVVHEKSAAFIPDSAPSLQTWSAMGGRFGESSATAVGYLIVENEKGLTPGDREYYRHLVDTIRNDKAKIDSVQDLASDPSTAPIAVSKDGKAMYALVRFYGGMGSAAQRHGQEFIDELLSAPHPNPDLRAYLTGPAPTTGDELEAEDETVALITGISVAMIVGLLLLVYRRFTTIIVPLASVGLALATARPIVGLLGLHAGLDVSVFTEMLLAALILGGGTDYAIFVISSYHEGRREGAAAGPPAIAVASARVANVIAASGLTVAASCAVMALTKVALFRTAGLGCSIGMLIAVATSLTLVPAMITLLARRGLVEPRPASQSRFWERLGVTIVRHPVAVFAASLVVLVLLALQLLQMTTGYDERAMQPKTTMSNQGYAAIARHYDPNELTPDYVVINADRDLRTPAGLSALNGVSRAIAEMPGVKQVRSATQPEGRPLPEFSLAHRDRVIADELSNVLANLAGNSAKFRQLTDGVRQLSTGLGQLSAGNAAAASGSNVIGQGLQQAVGGVRDLSSGADQLSAGSKELADSIASGVDPVLRIVNSFAPPPDPGGCVEGPGCDTKTVLASMSQDASLIGQVRYMLTRLKVGSAQVADGNERLAAGARQLRDGMTKANNGSMPLIDGQRLLTTKLGELARGAATAKTGTEQLVDGISEVQPKLQTLTDGLTKARDYLAEVGAAVGDTSDAGFYVPASAFDDPRLKSVLGFFVSRDGHSARLIVVNETAAYSPQAIDRVEAILATARQSLARTPFQASTVEATGLAAGFRDLEAMTNADLLLIAACALSFIFVILVLLLRSLVAPLYLIVTITLSYAAALGLSVLVWQELLGIDVYTAVPSLAFVALVAVGSDYNMMLMARIREESGMGVNTGIVRAFKATGGVVSTAGVIFALTMLAMLASPTNSIREVGFTIGAGLLLDTFVVRALMVPALAAMLGDRNWWPWGSPNRRQRSPRWPLGLSRGAQEPQPVVEAGVGSH